MKGDRLPDRSTPGTRAAATRVPGTRQPDEPGRDEPTFYSVAKTARILGTSEMTLYRAIQDGQFPALRIRGRLIIPARVIDEMVAAAMNDRRIVDTAELVRDGQTQRYGEE